jgi:hypothetical protein
MQSHQGRVDFVGFSFDEGKRLLAFEFHLVADYGPFAIVGGRQPGLGDAADELFAHAAVSNELLDGDDLEAMLAGDGVELVARCPISAVVENFAKDADGSQAGHTA